MGETTQLPREWGNVTEHMKSRFGRPVWGKDTGQGERSPVWGSVSPVGQEVASQRPPLSSPIHEMAIGHVKMHQLTSGITLPGKLLKHGGPEEMDTRSSSLSVKVALLVVPCDL